MWVELKSDALARSGSFVETCTLKRQVRKSCLANWRRNAAYMQAAADAPRHHLWKAAVLHSPVCRVFSLLAALDLKATNRMSGYM